MRDIISNDTLARIAKTVDEILDRMDSNTKRIEMPENIIDGDKVLFNYRQYDGVLYQVKVNDVNIIISDYTLDDFLSNVHMRLKISKNKYVYVNIADKGFRMYGDSMEERTPTNYDVWIPEPYEFTNNGYAGRFTRDYYVPGEHTNIQYVQYSLAGLTVGEEYTFTFKSKIALHHSGTSVEWRNKPYGLLFAYDSTIDHEVVDALPHDSGVWHSDIKFQSFYRDEQEHTYTCTITPEYSYMYITFIFEGVNSFDGYKSFTWSRFKSNKGINILDKEICFEGTWYNLGAGGGTSDLDAIELTYAEYQALTPAEKTDPDKIYFITDYPSGSGVVINPTGTATDTAETIEVDGTIYDFAGTDADAVHTADIGVAGGVAELDANGKVPSAQLPTYPTVGNGTITIQKNGTNVDIFTTNQSSNKTVNITMSKSDVGLGNVDNTSDANKPISIAMQAALDGKADASDVDGVKTVTGNPLTLTDGSETYADELVVDLEPIQSGSGTPSPSNVRPIQGYDIVSVDRCGKNLFGDIQYGYTIYQNKITANENCWMHIFKCEGETELNVKIFDKGSYGGSFNAICSVDGINFDSDAILSVQYPSISNGYSTTVTIPSGKKYIAIYGYMSGHGSSHYINTSKVQISFDSIGNTYEPYNGQTIAYQLGNKNLLPMTVEGIKAANSGATWNGNAATINGVTFTILTNENGLVTGIKANGTATATASLNIWYTNSSALTFNSENLYLSVNSVKGCGVKVNGSWVGVSTVGDYLLSSVNSITELWIGSGVSTVFDNVIYKPMLRSATVTDPTFSPYNPTLGGMVYGATVDVANGVMVVDKVITTKTWSDGTEATQLTNNIRKMFGTLSNASPNNGEISDKLPMIVNWTQDSSHFYIDPTSKMLVVFMPTNTSTSTEFTICYKLATPITIPLTPTQLKLLKGYNCISSNGTTIHLTYQPDNAVGDAVGEAEKFTERFRPDTDIVDTFNLYNGNTKVGSVSLLSNGFKLLYMNSYDDGSVFGINIPDKYIPKGPYQRAVVCLEDGYANPRIIEIYQNHITVTEDKFEQGDTYGTGLYY